MLASFAQHPSLRLIQLPASLSLSLTHEAAAVVRWIRETLVRRGATTWFRLAGWLAREMANNRRKGKVWKGNLSPNSKRVIGGPKFAGKLGSKRAAASGKLDRSCSLAIVSKLSLQSAAIIWFATVSWSLSRKWDTLRHLVLANSTRVDDYVNGSQLNSDAPGLLAVLCCLTAERRKGRRK